MNNIDKILTLAISNETSLIAAHSFQIISVGNEKIMKKALEKDLFRDKALELLVAPDPDMIRIGRLAGITLVFLRVVPEAQESCGFFYHLLKYCYYPPVSNFFLSLCNDDKSFSSIQTWLINMGIAEFIVREFNNTDFTYVSTETNPYKDEQYNKLICLYQIIKKASICDVLSPAFQSKDVVDCVKKQYPNMPDFLLSAQWSAICCLCTPFTAEFMTDLVDPAIKLVTESFEKMREYRVYALDFITAMMEHWPETYNKIVNTSILQLLTNTLVLFPGASIFHQSFRKFVATCLRNEQFSQRIVIIFTPVMIDIAKKRENRVLSASAFEVITDFMKEAKNNPKIKEALSLNPEWNDFIENEYKNYISIINSNYGGFTPINLFRSIKSLFGNSN